MGILALPLMPGNLCWGEGCGSGGPEKVVFLSSTVGIWGFLCP